MSEKIDIIVDSSTDVEAGNEIVSSSSDNNIDIEILEPDYNVTINKREYVITGDNLYIPKTYDESPQWLKDIIGTITDFSLNQKLTEIGALSSTLYGLIDELNVAKNTYTMSIINSAEIDERINARIETLNSSLSGSDATIVDLIATKATPTEASSLALNVLTASINDGAISSLVSNLQNAISTATSTLSNNIDILHSEMNGEFEGTADAIGGLRTYVGVSNDGGITGTGLLANVEILQKQNDGIIETTADTYDVMINPQDPNLAQLVVAAKPYATWKAADVTGISNRLAHIGDVYVKYVNTANGAKEYVASYKFIRTVIDETIPYATDSDGFTWALIVDQAAQDAYNQALNAYDLADNKRRVFTSQPVGDIDEGDLWVAGSNPQVTKVYKNGAWETADTQVAAFVSNTYTPAVASLQSQVDSKIESWYTVSTIDPKTAWTTAELKLHHNGDMWYQTDTKLSYYYSSSTNSWNLIDDAKAIQALADAATAQATADGVVVSFYAIKEDTAPITTSMWLNKTGTKVLKEYKTGWINVAVQTGDTLMAYDPITKDTSLYVYNGTGWITNTENGIVAGSEAITTLTANLATTNTTVGGHTTQLNTVDTRIANGVASVETKWAYNSVVNINGASYQSGFGLATSLTSGSGLPTGASEFWIKADKFKLMSADGGKKSSYSPFSVDTTTGAITFNGKVTFSNITDVPSLGTSSNNLLYNSAPAIGFETKGWQDDYNDTGMASSGVLASPDTYRPAGGGGFYQYISGTPAAGKVFDIKAVAAIPVIGGQFYEGSAYLSTHRCEGRIYVGWVDSAGATITWSMGDIVTKAAGNVLASWGRSKFIVQAPANAVSCYYYIRGGTTGESNPYVFVSMCYFGRAAEGQSVFSNWSEGISASLSNSEVSAISNAGVASNNDVFAQKLGYASYSAMVTAAASGKTIISGGYINTGLVNANSIVANSISADRLVAGTNSSTVWTGGGLISQNFNGNPYGNIGTPSTGFRLSSNATGTSTDPNIYGAYIQGSIIDVTDMKVRASGYPNNFGRISYAAKNIVVFMPNYSSGYAVNRLCSRALGIVKIDCWAIGYDDRVIISLQCTTDWTNWTTIRTHSSKVAGMTDTSHVTIVFSELLDNSWFSDNNFVGFRMIDAGSEQPATHVFSDILVSIFNS